jgi:hypothetical protein
MLLSPEEIEYFKKHESDSLQMNIVASNAAGLSLACIYRRIAHLGSQAWEDTIWLRRLADYRGAGTTLHLSYRRLGPGYFW